MFLHLIKIPISSETRPKRSSSTQMKSPAGSSSGAEGDSRGATINKDKDNATVRLRDPFQSCHQSIK